MHLHRMLAKSRNGLQKPCRRIDGSKAQGGLFHYIPDANPGSTSFRTQRLPTTGRIRSTKGSHCLVLLPGFACGLFVHVTDKGRVPQPDTAQLFGACCCSPAGRFYEHLHKCSLLGLAQIRFFFSFTFESILAFKKIQILLYF